jgi:hypothetical protein
MFARELFQQFLELSEEVYAALALRRVRRELFVKLPFPRARGHERGTVIIAIIVIVVVITIVVAVVVVVICADSFLRLGQGHGPRRRGRIPFVREFGAPDDGPVWRHRQFLSGGVG